MHSPLCWWLWLQIEIMIADCEWRFHQATYSSQARWVLTSESLRLAHMPPVPRLAESPSRRRDRDWKPIRPVWIDPQRTLTAVPFRLLLRTDPVGVIVTDNRWYRSARRDQTRRASERLLKDRSLLRRLEVRNHWMQIAILFKTCQCFERYVGFKPYNRFMYFLSKHKGSKQCQDISLCQGWPLFPLVPFRPPFFIPGHSSFYLHFSYHFHPPFLYHSHPHSSFIPTPIFDIISNLHLSLGRLGWTPGTPAPIPPALATWMCERQCDQALSPL